MVTFTWGFSLCVFDLPLVDTTIVSIMTIIIIIFFIIILFFKGYYSCFVPDFWCKDTTIC